eukprot:m.170300 g.170300  ORF g.170300 m.170300 type:complete len:508 (-) comp14527_c2_seq5:2753-4276(-)
MIAQALFWLFVILFTTVLAVVARIVYGLFPSVAFKRLFSKLRFASTGETAFKHPWKFPLGDVPAMISNFLDHEYWHGINGRVIWFGSEPGYELHDKEAVAELLNMDHSKLTRSTESLKVLNELSASGVLGASGLAWRRQHRILYKAFAPKNLSLFRPTIVQLADDFVEQMLAVKGSLDIQPRLNQLAFHVIMRMTFGNIINDEEAQEFLESFMFVIKESTNPLHDVPIIGSLPWISNPLRFHFTRLRRISDICLERRKAQRTASERTTDGKVIIDFILDAVEDAIADGVEQPMSDIEIRDNILNILAAGTETTATSSAWLLYELTQHPDILASIRREAEAADWELAETGGDLDEVFPYLTSVIRESLRLHSPLSGVAMRKADHEMKFGDILVPAGLGVCAGTFPLHRHEGYYPEPLKFDPNRFKGYTRKQDRSDFAYIPFGKGKRYCLGKDLAMQELQLVLARFVLNVDIEYSGTPSDVEIVWRPPMVQPRNGIQLSFKRAQRTKQD